MTPAEFYTYQFYAWEYRGRGWFLADKPVHLEAPFIPFFRHGGKYKQIDDGKRHTLISKAISKLRGTDQTIFFEENTLDYESIEPYLIESESELVALQVKVPKDRKETAIKMKALLSMLSYTYAPIAFELIGTDSELIIQFVTDVDYMAALESYTKAYFPQYSLIRNDQYIDGILDLRSYTIAIDFGLKEEFVRPLATYNHSGIDVIQAVIALIDGLNEGQRGGIQILFQPAINQWHESIQRSVTMYDGTSFFMDEHEAPKLASEKTKSPIYGVSIRAFVQGASEIDTEPLMHQLIHSVTLASKSSCNELIPLLTEGYAAITRVEDIILRESHRLGMLLSQNELLTFLHFPGDQIHSKKLIGTVRKTKALPAIARGKEFLLGENVHNGFAEPVTLSVEDRLKHMHIIGSTGTGKSTLIAQLIIQDIRHGHAVVVFDPHGDLINDVLASIPLNRLQDIVLIDPSDIEHPIGLNILEAHSDTEKEVLASDLVAAFKRYATSWGDQMSGVLGNAILALLECAGGGSIHDLRRFLIEKDFRARTLKTISDPAIRYYWEKESPIAKSNAIGPILMRLDTFLRPKSVRNIVIQKKGLDIDRLLGEGKIILLKLSQGLIGKENSFLLGTLFLSKLHQVILRRQSSTDRAPVFIYLDEFHNFITPSIKEMISGIRKYNVGLILVHQDLHQLQREDGELMNAVFGNVYTRIMFRMGEQDAKKLQEGLSEFTHTDLQNLGRGEAVVRIEQPQFDCSMTTYPSEPIDEDICNDKLLIATTFSRQNYAASKAEVEQILYESLTNDEQEQPYSGETKKTNPPQQSEPDVQPKPIVQPIVQLRKARMPELEVVEGKTESTHRYLQNLIKRMAESKGYTAILEQQLPDGTGKIDIALQKDKKRLAIEICVTTPDTWEVHNIVKCLHAKYDQVISVSGDIKQLEKIKRKCLESIPELEKQPISFFTPDALFQYLDEAVIPAETQKGELRKGYRINVTYDSVSREEMNRKRALVGKIVEESLRKRKK